MRSGKNVSRIILTVAGVIGIVLVFWSDSYAQYGQQNWPCYDSSTGEYYECPPGSAGSGGGDGDCDWSCSWCHGAAVDSIGAKMEKDKTLDRTWKRIPKRIVSDSKEWWKFHDSASGRIADKTPFRKPLSTTQVHKDFQPLLKKSH